MSVHNTSLYYLCNIYSSRITERSEHKCRTARVPDLLTSCAPNLRTSRGCICTVPSHCLLCMTFLMIHHVPNDQIKAGGDCTLYSKAHDLRSQATSNLTNKTTCRKPKFACRFPITYSISRCFRLNTRNFANLTFKCCVLMQPRRYEPLEYHRTLCFPCCHSIHQTRQSS